MGDDLFATERCRGGPCVRFEVLSESELFRETGYRCAKCSPSDCMKPMKTCSPREAFSALGRWWAAISYITSRMISNRRSVFSLSFIWANNSSGGRMASLAPIRAAVS